MQLQSLDHIRFVTRHFQDLQGLVYLVPTGLITLGLSALLLPAPWSLLAAVPFLAAPLLVQRARRYYRTCYGQIEPRQVQPAADLLDFSIYPSAGAMAWHASFSSPVAPAKRTLLICGLVLPWVPLLFSFLFCPPWITLQSGAVISERPVPGAAWYGLTSIPVPLLFLLAAFLFLGLWWLQECRPSQSYHLGFGILFGLGAFSPSPHWAVLLLAGLTMILAGVLDHWQLVRMLGPLPGQEES